MIANWALHISAVAFFLAVIIPLVVIGWRPSRRDPRAPRIRRPDGRLRSPGWLDHDLWESGVHPAAAFRRFRHAARRWWQ